MASGSNDPRGHPAQEPQPSLCLRVPGHRALDVEFKVALFLTLSAPESASQVDDSRGTIVA